MISLRWRLTLLLGLLLSLLLVVTMGGVYVAMNRLLVEKFDETLTAKARALITASEIDGGDFEIDLTVKNFAGFAKDGDDYFEIRRGSGEIFKRSPSFPKGHQERAAFENVKPPRDDQAEIGETQLLNGTPARFYVQLIKPKGDKLDRFQDLYLIVASSSERIKTEMRFLALVVGVASAGALVLMVPIIWFSLKKGLRPLGRLSAELEQIRPHELDRRLETALLPHELSPVVESLNAWLARLENSFERERQFTANAAHELRSPLAELKMMAELGAMAPEEATPERFTEVVAVVDELTGLLDKLAKLAESEIDGHDVSWTEWNLAEAVGEGTTRLRDRAAERRLVFQTEIGPGCFFTDPFIWRTIFDNLLSNAVEYSSEGSTILIAASPEKLYLRNLAPDLTRDDLDHLFDRFWRKEHKRFPQGHSGLGLSIVRGYVACLGGECHVSLTADHELVVEIRWGDHLAGTREGVG